MANATSITLTTLTANGETAMPSAQVLDTGTAAVTIKTPATSDADKIFLRVKNTAANAMTVTINAGVNPPAFRKSLGAFTTGSMAQNAEVWIGPFESARFKQADGTISVTFTPTVSTIAANFNAYRLPRT